MNRRDKQRLDDRRRKSQPTKPEQQNRSDLNISGSSKNLMDNYFQSQKNIQSLSDAPLMGASDVKSSKPFKIPKKQPAKSTLETKPPNRMISEERRRFPDSRDQFNRRRGSTNRKNPRDRGAKQDDGINSRGYAATIDKSHSEDRLYFNQPIEIIIADRAAPNGKISSENAQLFFNEIQEAVAKRILTTEPTYQTKFIDHKHDESGLITMTCADEFTSSFFQQKLKENLPLWPGARLGWSFGHFKSCFINLIVPHSIGHISGFLNRCKKTDSRMQTDKWRRIECENADDDSGIMFKLAVDKQSYEIMKQQGNVICCGDLKISIKLDEEIAEESAGSAK